MENNMPPNKQSSFISMLNISASIASLTAFIVMIAEKTSLPIRFGALMGAFIFGLWIISSIALIIYIIKKFHQISKKWDTLLRCIIWPLVIGVLLTIAYLLGLFGYVLLYDGISFILNSQIDEM